MTYHAKFEFDGPVLSQVHRVLEAESAGGRHRTRGAAAPKDFAVWSGLPRADARTGVASAVENSPGRFELQQLEGLQLWCAEQPVPLPAPPAPGWTWRRAMTST